MPDPIIVTKQMVEEFYDEDASNYDSQQIFEERGQRLVGLLDIEPGANVLDVATGTGAVLLSAARRAGTQGHVTGIDISASMLQQAKQVVAKSGLNNVSLLKMDAEHLDFPDSSFDAITCGFAIHYFSSIALQEMYRVCKRGGVIGVSVSGGPIPGVAAPSHIFSQLVREYEKEIKGLGRAYAPEEIESLLACHGFNRKKTLRDKTKEIVYADVEEYWRKNPIPTARLVLRYMDEETKARFKEELFGRLKAIMQPDGLHVSQYIIYLIAQK